MNLPLAHVWHGKPDPLKPLMVVLHGRGDSPEGYASFPAEFSLDLNYLMLQAPNPYFEGYSWYDHPPNQLPGILESSKLLESTFQELKNAGYKSNQIFLFGFSQGCLMTLEFGARYPERLAGYIGVSGYCYDPAALIKDASPAALSGDWLVTHGTQDDVLPFDVTAKQIQFLNEQGFPIEFKSYIKTHTILETEIHDLKKWIQARLVRNSD